MRGGAFERGKKAKDEARENPYGISSVCLCRGWPLRRGRGHSLEIRAENGKWHGMAQAREFFSSSLREIGFSGTEMRLTYAAGEPDD